MSSSASPAHQPTYYDRPLLKAPVWRWYIPAYFVTGGMAGASATLTAAIQLRGRSATNLDRLVRRGRVTALAALAVSAVLLVADLGRPSRFANMLRVVRPSSPMSVGSWLLAGFAPTVGAAAVLPTGVMADAAGLAAGAMGPLVASYTGVLVAASAVPAWRGASRSLPILFPASGVIAASSALALLPCTDAEAAVLRRYAIAGTAAELAAGAALVAEVSASGTEAIVRPYRRGPSGRLWQAGEALVALSLLLSLPRRRHRGREVAAAVTGLAGSSLAKIAVMEAGRASALDPAATFGEHVPVPSSGRM